MFITDREGYGPILSCSSSDVIGSAVRLVSPGVVTTADSTSIERSLVIGFIISKPTNTTCLITDKYYYSGTSGFSGFSGIQGSTGFANPIYLTNNSGFSGNPGSISKVIGQAISPREAILQADVSETTGFIYKNRIINGDMIIAQRNPTASGASAVNGTFMADRFRTEVSYDGTPTWTWDTDVPTNSQSGRQFKRSLKFISTQDSTIGASQFVWLWQKIEGYNIVDLFGDGYNNGFTLSFWVKSSTTGTYCVCFSNSARNRNYTAEYVINTVNTWEYKTITVTSPPPSGGTWDTTNGTGLYLQWILCSGSTYNVGTNGTWNSNAAPGVSTPNQVNFASAGTNNFWLTGVQLEPGKVATPFEFRPYSTELALCHRYCYVFTGSDMAYIAKAMGYKSNATVFEQWVPFPVPMRASPTGTHNVTGFNSGGGASGTNISIYDITAGAYRTGTFSAFSITGSGKELGYINATITSLSGTIGQSGWIGISESVFIVLTAEL